MAYKRVGSLVGSELPFADTHVRNVSGCAFTSDSANLKDKYQVSFKVYLNFCRANERGNTATLFRFHSGLQQ